MHESDFPKQEAHGPRVAHLSDIATADMQHFSNPFIATNENIIILADLNFEENIYDMTVNGAWSFEQTLNHISTVVSMWNLIANG